MSRITSYKLVYFAYPYSADPERFTREACEIAREVYALREDLVIIIPHLLFDKVYRSPEEAFRHVTEILIREHETIARCDYLMYDSRKISVGVQFEIAFATWLGKPVYTVEQVKRGEDLNE